MNLSAEKSIIRDKYKTEEYPERFVESVIHQHNQCSIQDTQSLIPDFFFDEPKQFLLIKIPFCFKNENTVKRFIQKLYQFTQNKFDIATKWVTKSRVY